MIERDTFDAEQFARLWQETFRWLAAAGDYAPDILPWEQLPHRHRDLLIRTAAQVLDELDKAALLTVTRPWTRWGAR